ncbi:hypothetical protein [Gluconacetobacter sacchari]|uniref:Uncharacterized protein n=1 Tax=Gluconacetobacter sacchari TaxID=92759 RepID=A0A7W4NT21_9PROT|nr:hypothetical protein [Gluconacetobacter sacchari]MBB2161835.1 hypothetical protein [Gluconacetobacter sacchari]
MREAQVQGSRSDMQHSGGGVAGCHYAPFPAGLFLVSRGWHRLVFLSVMRGANRGVVRASVKIALHLQVSHLGRRRREIFSNKNRSAADFFCETTGRCETPQVYATNSDRNFLL